MTATSPKSTLKARRGDPWFEDGNIVLVSEDSTIAFKVHRDFLSRHSEVFQTMFSVPPSSDVEVLDNCTVVRMFDPAFELANLIRALYDSTKFRSVDDFLYVAGILRLSTKYCIQHLRGQAIQCLARTWSHTLRGHDEMVEMAVKAPLVDNKSYPYVHPLHILNLARETDVQILIPSALYSLSLYLLQDILSGDHPKLRIEHPSCPSSQLSHRDLQDYTLMFQHRIDIVMDFLRGTCGERIAAPQCTHPETCTKAFKRLSSHLSRTWKVRTGPLHYMVQVSDQIASDANVCGACRKAFKQDVGTLREDLWKRLPTVVGLASWEELEKRDLPN